jgi:predicted PurR-regulated permease PerM
LLRLYLLAFPPRLRDPAAQALTRSSVMVVGWMWSNVIVGGLEAVAAFFFRSFMDIPGALVWASLTLFAELLPKIGAYVMATPPTLVALSVSPLTGLWVALFYVVLNELTGSLLMPRVRASTMDLHPVSTLFMMLAMGSAFGLAGALVATPVAAYLKAYFEVFYLSRFPRDPQLDARVEAILHRRERG